MVVGWQIAICSNIAYLTPRPPLRVAERGSYGGEGVIETRWLLLINTKLKFLALVTFLFNKARICFLLLAYSLQLLALAAK